MEDDSRLNKMGPAAAVGYGTGGGSGLAAHEALTHALRFGYRWVDCAPRYSNQRDLDLPLALERSGVARESVHVTSKLWSTCMEPRRVREACQHTLNELGLEHLDLFLLHSPVALSFTGIDLPVFVPRDASGLALFDTSVDLAETWRAMLALRDDGLVQSVGVSNFDQSQLDRLLNGDDSSCSIPVCNQIEIHPHLPQHRLVAGLKERGIRPVAFSPLGCPSKNLTNVLSDHTIVAIAERNHCSPAQVALGWNLRRGVTVIPHSTSPVEIEENLAAASVAARFGEDDMRKIDRLGGGGGSGGGGVRTLCFDWLPFSDDGGDG